MRENDNRPYKNTAKNGGEQTVNQPLPDGGVDPVDLTLFQHAALAVIAEEPRYGQAVKRELEDLYAHVNHGRLYPNLNTLVEKGLADKRELDRRSFEYSATDAGRQTLAALTAWIDDRRQSGTDDRADPAELVDEWLDSGRGLSELIEVVESADRVIDAHQRLGVTSIPRTRRLFDELGLLEDNGKLLSGDELDAELARLGRHVELTPIADGGNDIEGISLPDEGVDLTEFVEIAEERGRGAAILDEPQDVDLRLVELSASFLDPDGMLRTFSITAEGFDPEDYEHDFDNGGTDE